MLDGQENVAPLYLKKENEALGSTSTSCDLLSLLALGCVSQ